MNGNRRNLIFFRKSMKFIAKKLLLLIDYYIVFIDPKGTEHTEAYRKIDGFKNIFENQLFPHNGFNIKVKLFCEPEDEAYAIEQYKEFWLDNIHKILGAI